MNSDLSGVPDIGVARGFAAEFQQASLKYFAEFEPLFLQYSVLEKDLETPLARLKGGVVEDKEVIGLGDMKKELAELIKMINLHFFAKVRELNVRYDIPPHGEWTDSHYDSVKKYNDLRPCYWTEVQLEHCTHSKKMKELMYDMRQLEHHPIKLESVKQAIQTCQSERSTTLRHLRRKWFA